MFPWKPQGAKQSEPSLPLPWGLALSIYPVVQIQLVCHWIPCCSSAHPHTHCSAWGGCLPWVAILMKGWGKCLFPSAQLLPVWNFSGSICIGARKHSGMGADRMWIPSSRSRHKLLWTAQGLRGPQRHRHLSLFWPSLLFGERLIIPFPKAGQCERFDSFHILIHFRVILGCVCVCVLWSFSGGHLIQGEVKSSHSWILQE